MEHTTGAKVRTECCGLQSRDGDSGSHLPDFEGIELATHPTQTDSENALEPVRERSDRLSRFKVLWRRHVSLLVDPRACRDHLANERTFLAWLRTSLALSMIGILTTQLFTLQSAHLPNMNLSFFVLGIPLGSVCQAAALVNIIVGAYRFWRLQTAMAKGQACVGGWELLLVSGMITLIIVVFLILVVLRYQLPMLIPELIRSEAKPSLFITQCSMSASPQRKDYWSSQSYSAAASFVPQLTARILQYLNPQPTDRVLDIGCGDGKFTANYSDSVADVYGVDASPSFIASGTQNFASSRVRFKVVDCRYLEKDTAVTGAWDKIVSNAALHWILRDPSSRTNTLRACFQALKSGGTFVFEMGAAGNVPEVHAAVISALVHQGAPIERARASSPWFFPSDVWMRKALEDIGFEIDILEVGYRPTGLTTCEQGGLRGWVKLMAASMLDVLEDEHRRDAAISEVCDVLSTIITRIEDGSQWLGYVRLRSVARKP